MSSAGRKRRFDVGDLFTDTSPRAVGVTDLVEAKEIRLDRIKRDPNQPRTEFNQESLDELAASIHAEGVLQPIAVRYDEVSDCYIIIHGERRWRAAGLAGLDTIPAILRDVPEERRLILQLMENIVREDLSALDRAAALQSLKSQMDDAPWEQVAEAVGIRRSRLFQLLGTQKLSPAMQDALRRSLVSEKQTRNIQRLSEDIQEEVGARVLAGSLAPNSLDATGRSLRLARTISEARKILDGLETRDPVKARQQRLVRSVTRKTRSARAVLDELVEEGLDQRLTPSAKRELEQLAVQIEQILHR